MGSQGTLKSVSPGQAQHKRVTDDPRAPAAAPELSSDWSAAMLRSDWSGWRHPGLRPEELRKHRNFEN